MPLLAVQVLKGFSVPSTEVQSQFRNRLSTDGEITVVIQILKLNT